MEEIENILWNMTNDSLKEQAKLLGLKTSGNKLDLVKRILSFYDKKDFVLENYNNMNDMEKEYINNIVSQKYFPTEDSTLKIKEKYKNKKMSLDRVYYYYVRNVIPRCFKIELEKIVPPFVMNFEKVETVIDLKDHYGFVCIEDNSVVNFDLFVKFLNQYKIKPTTKNRLLPKSAFLKFIKEASYMEVTQSSDMFNEDIKTVADTVITHGMFKILSSASVITNSKEYFALGSNYKEYIKMNRIEKIRFLLDKYINSSPLIINEAERVSGIFKLDDWSSFSESRKYILEVIKKLPVNTWINGESFIKNIRMDNYCFLREYTGNILEKNDYDNWYYPCYFYDFDSHFIEICLLEYFAVLGIVDVVLDIESDDWGYREYLVVKYLKLTEFGSIVLGLSSNSLDDDLSDIPLIINENLEIVILEGKKRMEYELFFDRFLMKINNDLDRTIYKIDFKGLARAIDLGIKIEEIEDYIKDEALDVPKQLIELFGYAKSVANKIKIKNITVIEFPFEFASSIETNKKLNTMFDRSFDNIIPIDSKRANEIKKELEKNNLFCYIDLK